MEIKIIAWLILWLFLTIWLWPAVKIAKSDRETGIKNFAWYWLAIFFSWFMYPIYLFATRKKGP